MKKINVILGALFALFILSCSSDNNNDDNDLTISEEIKDLIYFNGNEKANTVVINIQSGSDIELVADEVDFLRQNLIDTNSLLVTVHQAQTLNPTLVDGDDISLNEATAINIETVDILSRVITYFKEQGRTVHIFGESFGAFVTQELIAEKGMNIADNYLIMIGRLDMNDVIWQGLLERRYGYFENGITPILEDEVAVDNIERNLVMLAAEFASNKYTQKLNQFQDLSKITYIYGKADEAVGRLTESEVQFLASRNANIIVGEGNHDETLNQFIFQGFEEAFGIE
ncbi:hypothetical protein [uncultured Kordia sp.]|uniref:hypothetical protein n=1 Tax=uncultured Kordia sp. TaxID=507699 RepID=UPI00262496BE|nr:hypothetical protein [uncultured Kordia sp.]